MQARDRHAAEQAFHDRQARQRAVIFAHHPDHLHFDDDFYLDHETWVRPAFRQLFTTTFMPDATGQQTRWFNELQRKSASPDNAANILRSVTAFDVDDLLAQVRIPTLVLHCRG